MHFLSLKDINRDVFVKILNDALAVKKDHSFLGKPLAGKYIGLLFEKHSTRTRISFEVGISRLGGYPLVLNSKDIQLSRGESIADTARVLSGYLDGIMVRTHSHRNLEELARYGSIPVINGLSDSYHPCQALADFMTVVENEKKLDQVVISYIGDGSSNVCHSLIMAAGLMGAEMRICSPAEYHPDVTVVREATDLGGKIRIFEDPVLGCQGADVLYTDVWISMGQEGDAERKKIRLQNYQLDMELVKVAAPDSIVMHCLPAHKGEEISEEVFESKHSRVFQQAENRLYVQMALLAHIYSQS